VERREPAPFRYGTATAYKSKDDDCENFFHRFALS
jgi:hypothetical protein